MCICVCVCVYIYIYIACIRDVNLYVVPNNYTCGGNLHLYHYTVYPHVGYVSVVSRVCIGHFCYVATYQYQLCRIVFLAPINICYAQPMLICFSKLEFFVLKKELPEKD